MKKLLIVTAFLEGLTGLSLLVAPSFVISLLVGVSMDSPAGPVAGQIAGASLLALAIACWQFSNAERRSPPTGIVKAMLSYNIAATLVLFNAIAVLELRGILLVPAIAGHLVLGTWCLLVLWPAAGNLKTP